uniref:Uncharacterized protein n=1 Tax=Chlamydomonas euryale TaxID=1486919 RepID=A0A7R9VSB9_9CHLO|mmetsp:Transcript_42377/g.127031  ORF Transcript_42377/g.127031 Transcript_42377/m.127031 type:complete len:113 (+) Transcript_42377:266-604(+)|eukprot:358019-Chlamydomonas_euryale.AAC.4
MGDVHGCSGDGTVRKAEADEWLTDECTTGKRMSSLQGDYSTPHTAMPPPLVHRNKDSNHAEEHRHHSRTGTRTPLTHRTMGSIHAQKNNGSTYAKEQGRRSCTGTWAVFTQL